MPDIEPSLPPSPTPENGPAPHPVAPRKPGISLFRRRTAADIIAPRLDRTARPAPSEQKKADHERLALERREARQHARMERAAKRKAEKDARRAKITRRFPSKAHWRYFPVVFAPWERHVFSLGILILMVGIVLLAGSAFGQLLEPVPTRGGSYTEGILGQPEQINPLLLKKDADRDLAQLMYAGLMRYNAQQELEPDLAESYEVSDEGKTYVFHLREHLVWQDGKPLTADDVVFTVGLMKDPEVKSPRRADFQSVTAETVDERTVKFSLSNDAFVPFLRENTTFGILPKHLWENVAPSQVGLSDLNLRVVGAGPFAFDQFRKDKETSQITSYALKRNKKYHGQKAYLDSITFRFYDDADLLLRDFRKGKIDGIHSLSPSQKASIPERTRQKWQIHELQLPSYFALFFNTAKSDILKDEKVRRALGSSLDREAIVKEALNGAARVTDAPILPSFLGFNPEITRLTHDDGQAQTLLDEAGWKIPEGGTIRKKGDIELVIEVVMPDHDPFPKIGAVLKREWEGIGVKTEITMQDSATLRSETIRPRAYQVLLFGQSIAHDPDPYPFWHSSLREDPGLNLTSYKNSTVDELLTSARKETDEHQRTLKYLHFQNELARDLPAIFLYVPTYTYALDRGIRGVELSAITFPSDRFADANLWHRRVNWRFQLPTNKKTTEEKTASKSSSTPAKDASDASVSPMDNAQPSDDNTTQNTPTSENQPSN